MFTGGAFLFIPQMSLTAFLKDIGRPVSYYPSLARLIGVKECVFVCQLAYWQAKYPDREEFYKSGKELEEELGMSPDEQLTVRKSLVRKGIISERHARLEHRVYLTLNAERLDEIWEARKIIRNDNPAHLSQVGSRNGRCPIGETGDARFTVQAMPDSSIQAETTTKSSEKKEFALFKSKPLKNEKVKPKKEKREVSHPFSVRGHIGGIWRVFGANPCC